jgi:hypothetical protein
MQGEIAECPTGIHDLLQLGSYYQKIKKDANWLDWLLGTEMDMSKSFSMTYCAHCGISVEVLLEDMNSIQGSEAIVHEIALNKKE